MRGVLLMAGLITVLTISCKKSPQQDPLDSQLSGLLERSSGGIGSSYYLLPDNTDYSSIPQDPRNPLTPAKVELGKQLFHETGLAVHAKYAAGMETFSCASCHHVDAAFQAGVRQGIGDGGSGFGAYGEGRGVAAGYSLDSIDVQAIRTPSAMNMAYQEVVLWNGQFGATGPNSGTQAAWTAGTPKEKNFLGYQGLETQAIAGLGVHRLEMNLGIADKIKCKAMFDKAFPDVPESERYTKITAGLAIAAYERTLLSSEAPFQDWLRGENYAMSDEEKRGAILFFGKAKCYHCHNGPALNSMDFYALGMKNLEGPGIYGHIAGAPEHKGRGGFTGNPEDEYKFKVPQLYGLRHSPFYGHGGTFTSVVEIIRYKNAAVKANPNVPDQQLATLFTPLNLTDEEIQQLAVFIENSLDDNNLIRLVPEALQSGNCFPNADPTSIADLGCQ